MKYNPKKLEEYEALIIAQQGIVTKIAEKLKVTTKTIYSWKKEHPEFKEVFDLANDSVLDFAESQLYKNVLDGKEASIFFLLKCRGKSRGYIEKEVVAEITLSGKDIRYDHESMNDTIPKA
jgi:hypothetical protein